MAGLSWFPVDASLRSHPKALALAASLDDARAHTWLVDLWAWAYRNAPMGTIRGKNPGRTLEMAVGWTGPADRLWTAMVDTGWLDQTADGLAIHDWTEHAGPLLAKAKRDAERAAERRADVSKRFEATSRRRRGDVAATSAPKLVDVAGNNNPNPNTNTNPLPSEEIKKTAAPDDVGQGTPTQVPATAAPGETEPKFTDAVRRVFEHWAKATGPRAKLTPDRRRRVEARLREGYTVEALCKAIDGNLGDPWFREKQKHDLELICRSAAKVDDFIGRADALAPTNTGPPPEPCIACGASGTAVWLEHRLCYRCGGEATQVSNVRTATDMRLWVEARKGNAA